jgi:hypothetical protein
MSNENNSVRWELPPESLRNASAALEDYLAARSQVRLDSQASVAPMNTAMATAMAQEFEKANIDLKKLEAVGLDNFARCRQLMEEYRDRAERHSRGDNGGPGKVPYVSLDLPEGAEQRPFNVPSLNVIRTPPFDLTGFSVQPANTSAFVFGSANQNTGSMLYDISSNANVPVNADVSALLGIFVTPVVNNGLSAFPGTAAVQMNTSFFQDLGFASCQFFGNAVSTASVGWIIQEFDQSGNFVGIAQENYVDEFDLSVSFGQTKRGSVQFPSFSQSTAFSTVPFHFYAVFFWLLGEIRANQATGWWGSTANADSTTTLTSIAWQWTPAPPPPPLVAVPDVRGDAVANAAATIRAAGLGVSIQPQNDPLCNNLGQVMSQSPAPGTMVPQGTFVTIMVGQHTGQCP